MRKYDTYWLGIIIGLILPLLFSIAYAYTIGLQYLWHREMFEMLKPVIARMLLLSIFPDMAVVFIFYEFNLWHIAKGTIIGLFPYLIAGMIFMG